MPDRVRLTVPSETRSLALVDAVTTRYGESLSIPTTEIAALAANARDLVQFTLDHAYPGDPTGEVELTLDLVDRCFQIDVHDWGRPLISAGGDLGELPPELQEIASCADDLRLINLGADGKRLVFTKAVSKAVDTAPGAHAFGEPSRRPHPDGDDLRDRMVIREATPADAEAISQLLYENYHLTYGHPNFYRPRWVAEQIGGEALLSSLAALDGEIIGHHAVMLERGNTSAETGVAVVHPAYRGLGIFNHLLDYTLERCEVRGLDAVWGRAVTVHPYSQRSEQSHGYRDAALMLGSVPARMAMEGVEGAPGKRTASLVAYRILRPSARAVAFPERYADLLRAAYANVDLPVTQVEPVEEADGDPISVVEDGSRATGFIKVAGWDPGGFAKALRHLLARHHDVIYADLDLHRGVATDEAVDRLSEIGFFYSGLVLHGSGGHDFLRMQRMNAENVEVEQIVCDAPYAQALLRAVLADRELADG